MIETLYIGHRNTNPISICIYNKKKQLFDKHQSLCPIQDRIEIRFNFKISSKNEDGICKNWWFLFAPNSFNAHFFRCTTFLSTLMETIIVCKTQRPSFWEDAKKNVAPWWYDLIIHPLQNFIELYKSKLKQKNFERNIRILNKKVKEKILEIITQWTYQSPTDFFDKENFFPIDIDKFFKNLRNRRKLRPLFLRNKTFYYWPPEWF